MATGQIMTFDGGGVRGLLTARIVQAFEERKDGRVRDYVNSIYATSTGTLIASALLSDKELRAKEVVQMYVEYAPRIFHSSYLREVATVDGVLSAKYDDTMLVEAISHFSGSSTLKSLKVDVYFPVYEWCNPGKAFWFTTHMEQDFPLVDILRATTAAPTFFNAKTIQIGDTAHDFVDGGLVCNNPVEEAVLKGLVGTNQKPNFTVFSVGTGRYFHKAPHWVNTHAGLAEALPYLFEAVSEYQSVTATSHASLLVSDSSRFFRAQPTLLNDIALDDAEKMGEILKIATDYLEDQQDKLLPIFDLFQRVGPKS